MLNVKYYHVVFTIPSEIYNIAYQNQEKMYKILFKASSETLQELAKDKKYLGGEVGFFSILHTWGQNLMYHPHIHIVVTGGGLTETNKWKEKKEDFFIPVRVMSKVFRGKFLYYMKKEKLEFYNKMKEMKISIEEFIRRFMMHILPPNFMKIRYYGILGNRNKKKKLLKCKILTRTNINIKKKLPTLELLKQTLGKDFNLCPHCKKRSYVNSKYHLKTNN